MVCDRCADDSRADNDYMSLHFEPGTYLYYQYSAVVEPLPMPALRVMIPLAMDGVDTKLRQGNQDYFVDARVP